MSLLCVTFGAAGEIIPTSVAAVAGLAPSALSSLMKRPLFQRCRTPNFHFISVLKALTGRSVKGFVHGPDLNVSL